MQGRWWRRYSTGRERAQALGGWKTPDKIIGMDSIEISIDSISNSPVVKFLNFNFNYVITFSYF
jgi:hypothetical protein